MVEVAFVTARLVPVAVVQARLVVVAFVEVRFVIVAFGTVRRPRRLRLVPVAFTKRTLFRLVRPET